MKHVKNYYDIRAWIFIVWLFLPLLVIYIFIQSEEDIKLSLDDKTISILSLKHIITHLLYFFLFILQFENVRDIPAPLRMNTPHRRNIVALVPPLLGSEEETYPKNPSKFLKSGFMIIAIMRIQVTGKRLLLREKPTSPFCKFVTGLSMLEDAYFLK